MSKFFRISNISFIGGSLVNHGGQNPLEAVRMGNYVMHGNKIDNFKEIYKKLNNLNLNYINNLLIQIFLRKKLLK